MNNSLQEAPLDLVNPGFGCQTARTYFAVLLPFALLGLHNSGWVSLSSDSEPCVASLTCRRWQTVAEQRYSAVELAVKLPMELPSLRKPESLRQRPLELVVMRKPNWEQNSAWQVRLVPKHWAPVMKLVVMLPRLQMWL